MGWTVSSPQPGLTVKQIEIPIFNSEQSISLIEIDTAYYALHFTQRKDRETVQRLARKASADAAVNGGFFVTKTERALANDYLEIDGKLAAHKKDWGFGSAAVAVVDGTNLEFTLWNKEMGTNDTDWVSQYENVMAAGPLLLLDGECKVAHNTNQDRHPRTVIGCKPDGKLILLVVDGRQEGADGMTLAELGYTCYALGMSDAMNLDGGGSSSLWVKGERYVNQPSDKVLFFRVKRPVANAVVVKPKPGR